MMIVSALKVLADILFYMAFAGSVGAIFGGSRILVTLPFFAVAILLSSLLSNRGALRFAPMVLLVGAYFVVPLSIANILVLTPACIYTIVAIPRPDANVREYDYIRVFHMFLYIFIPFFILLYVLRQRTALAAAAFPIGLVFISAAILLMRMLRHDESVLQEKKFMVRNLLSVAGIIAFSLAIGSQTFFDFLKAMISFLYKSIIVPLLMYSIMGILYVFSWIFSLFTGGEARSFADNPLELDLNFDFGFFEDYEEVEVGAGGKILEYVLYTLAAAIIIFIVVRIFKALSRKSIAEARQADYVETRTSLNVSAKPQKKTRRSASGRIREIYRKLLELCRDRGLEISPNLTSRDVERISSMMFGKPQEAHQMRDIYIKVRYAEEKPDQNDIKDAKALYEAFKKDSAAG